MSSHPVAAEPPGCRPADGTSRLLFRDGCRDPLVLDLRGNSPQVFLQLYPIGKACAPVGGYSPLSPVRLTASRAAHGRSLPEIHLAAFFRLPTSNRGGWRRPSPTIGNLAPGAPMESGPALRSIGLAVFETGMGVMDFENLLTAGLALKGDGAMKGIAYTDDRQALLYGIPYRTEIAAGEPMEMALYTQSAALADIFSASKRIPKGWRLRQPGRAIFSRTRHGLTKDTVKKQRLMSWHTCKRPRHRPFPFWGRVVPRSCFCQGRRLSPGLIRDRNNGGSSPASCP